MNRLFAHVIVAACFMCAIASAQDITVATYNVENFNSHFEAHRLTTQPIARDPVGKDVIAELRKANDEDNWEVAQVILDPKFSPDILVIEEGCEQDDLRFFNRRWLNDAYETAITFPTNTDRHQNLCMLLKSGFKILHREDKYYQEPDTVGNERGYRLFARGPAFCLIQAPSGYKFWVGVTHMKSKNVGAGGSDDEKDTPAIREKRIDAAKWRLREAKRTHEIMKELEAKGPADVILLGDMNDSVGFDAYEKDAGGDAIATLVGPPADGFTLATQPLFDSKQFSYNGYWRTNHHELIDHAVVSKSMKNHVEDVEIFHDAMTPVASDHFPVMVKLKAN